MRTRRSPHPQSLFRGSEATRLMGAIFLLALVGMLIYRTRDPAMWTWLADDSSAAEVSATEASNGPAESGGKEAPSSPATAQQTPLVSGPTDEDPDEAAAIAEEFQALSDGSLSTQTEEMPAYERVVRWVTRQPAEVLRKRARKDLLFTHFMQFPDKYRGKLVQLDLNVRRVVDMEENREGVHLHEACGWTSESRAWLYWTAVVDYPKDMPVGPNVWERAIFVGYFFKLQGYHEGGAKPNAPPLKAPLFIGRLIWQPAPVKPESHDGPWLLLALGVFAVVVVGGQVAYMATRRRRRAVRAVPGTSLGAEPKDDLEQWLSKGPTINIPDGNNGNNSSPADEYVGAEPAPDETGRNGPPPR